MGRTWAAQRFAQATVRGRQRHARFGNERPYDAPAFTSIAESLPSSKWDAASALPDDAPLQAASRPGNRVTRRRRNIWRSGVASVTALRAPPSIIRLVSMTGSWSHRFLASFFALWLSLVGLESSVLFCPMHEMRHAATDAAVPDVMIGMSMPGEEAGDIPLPEHASHRCSCPGTCSSVPVGSLPSFQIAFGGLLRKVNGSEFVATIVRLVPPDFTLPLSTAPPLSPLL